jgi:IclR family acetate operon transcriptional repressor
MPKGTKSSSSLPSPSGEGAVRDGGAPAIERAMATIELLADKPDGLTLSELARLLDVNKALAHRVLQALDAAGYVFRVEPAGLYRLTYKVRNIGLRHMSSTHLLDQNLSVLQGLADMTDELVRLAVVEGDTLTWVAALQGTRRMLQLNPNYTFHIHLHTHATGKIWLSTLPRAHALELVHNAGIEPRTENSVTDLARLEAELDLARERGYAMTYEEDEVGVGAVAAPIMARQLDGSMRCVGVVSLAAPTSRMSREQLDSHHPLVVAAAGRLADRWPADTAGNPLKIDAAPPDRTP